jgi:hypothetical protein
MKPKTETQETIAVARWLRQRRIFFCHVPNEGARGRREAAILSAMGTRKGIPDLLIFSTTEAAPKGVAMELKRSVGGKVSDAQEHCLSKFGDIGWHTCVCHGADAAIARLIQLGYDTVSHVEPSDTETRRSREAFARYPYNKM